MDENAATIRKKRIRFRSWHRGTREMDILLGGFTDTCIEEMSEREIEHFEALLEEADDDLRIWLMADKPWPLDIDETLVQKLKIYMRKRL